MARKTAAERANEARRQHDPFAPQTARQPEPTFPEDRLRRAGMTDDEVTLARTEWEGWNPQERTEALNALAALSDDELAAQVADRDGTADAEPEALVGDGSAGGQAVAGVEGERPDDSEPGVQISGETADGDVVPPAVEQVAPGGPGEAVEAPADGEPAAGADPSPEPANADTDALALRNDAEQRVARGATVEQMREWVGDDPARAAAALAAEQNGKNRKTLVEALEAIVSGG